MYVKNYLEKRLDIKIKLRKIHIKHIETIRNLLKPISCLEEKTDMLDLILYYNKYEMYKDDVLETTPLDEYIEEVLERENIITTFTLNIMK